jgi:hypothetical protein
MNPPDVRIEWVALINPKLLRSSAALGKIARFGQMG